QAGTERSGGWACWGNPEPRSGRSCTSGPGRTARARSASWLVSDLCFWWEHCGCVFRGIQCEFVQRNVFRTMSDDVTLDSDESPAEEGVVAVRRAMKILEAFGVDDAHL